MSVFERFQSWFLSQCDGDWEHGAGITISSIDNPGWSLRINLEGTNLEGKCFNRLEMNRTELDWLHAWKTGEEFGAACGPQNLGEAVSVFCDWADK